MPNILTNRIGGITFIKLFRLRIQLCVAKKPQPVRKAA